MSGRNRGRYSGGSGGGGYGGGNRGRKIDNFNDNYGPPNMMNSFNIGNHLSNSDLMQLMMMASNFNMNPPPPPPMRLGCGELRPVHIGMCVEITGRLLKKRVSRFVELRDRNGGACQLVILEDKYPRVARRLFNMPENTVITAVGVVMRRPSNSYNQTMPTGEIEVEIQDIINIDFGTGSKRPADKRSYSTLAQQNSCGITSTEYKVAKNENILKYFENRDLTCNDLRRNDIGKVVTLVGWIPSTKNSKFMQLKDGYGQTQIIIEDQTLQDTCLSAPEQTVVQVTGKVLGRPKANINLKYETGEIEVMVDSVKILNPDDPYDGPIKSKEKIQKMSIDDANLNNDDAGSSSDTPTKNGSSIKDEKEIVEKMKVADTNKYTHRTHNCGELTVNDVGQKVVLCGWLEFQRMGKFFVLRDGYGQTQIIITEKTKGLEKHAQDLPLESILHVEGLVIPRPTATINPKMLTGYIEVDAHRIQVLNFAKKHLPFEVRKFNRAGERLRLTHRYLDLRFSDMQRNLRTRSAVMMRMRDYLINYVGFVDVETPTLFRRTPGGAQEFIVPTRKAGHCYSLVQSPQQFKQMLMAGAIDRYFQIARCYRDEATRRDRQPEFTQLDIELSFTTREGVMQLIEELLRFSWPREFPRIQTPFRRITYEEAMEKYGTDKPDTRFGFILNNVTEIVENNEEFRNKYKKMGAYAIVVRGSEAFWNGAARMHYESWNKEFSGSLFVRKFTQYKDVLERLSKFLTADVAREIIEKFDLEENDLIFLGVGEKDETREIMGRIRVDYYNFLTEYNKIKKSYENKFLWVIDFPLFARNEETGQLESVHHPFTAPHADDLNSFITAKTDDLVNIRSQAYDLVLNGQEIGGGSIRIHDHDIQQFVMEQILKIPTDNFKHLLNALSSGCPPHGGIALGLDRLMAIICRARSIRDVIAFPKSLNGRDPLSNAPVLISDEEKSLYHLTVVEDDNDNMHAQEDDDPDLERKPPTPLPDESFSNNDINLESKEALIEQTIIDAKPTESELATNVSTTKNT